VLISAVIWWLFARVMTAKTLKGARTHIAVLGFQEFMNRVDAERLKTMPPTTFEKFLPYAMALGVEHHWAQAFAGIVKDPPSLVRRPGRIYAGMAFNPIFFSSSMHGMATDMHQVFVSAPRASLHRIRLRRWWRLWRRRRLLRRRLRRRWRQRLLKMVRPERLELPTLCSEGRCSIQLSYGRMGIPRAKRAIVHSRAKRCGAACLRSFVRAKNAPL
jgi:hypothetical protein